MPCQNIWITVVALLMLSCCSQTLTSKAHVNTKHPNVVKAEQPCDRKAEDIFPDYQPKLSADDVLDYRPALLSEINRLPSVNSDTFTQAVTDLVLQNIKALEKPGKWISGNVALGADPDEYIPSDEELLAAELGDRLADYVSSADVSELIEAWKGEALLPLPIEYKRFEYRHVDVMGSGRFFYASKPIRAIIQLRQQNHQ